MRFSVSVLVGLLAATIAPVVPSAFGAPTRGYIARGCGFDLNFNGIAGEPADCANICRGGPSDVDIDGNGVADSTVYVNCSGGSNTTSCGSATSPCGSIQWALGGSNTGFANRIGTPATNQIQAVCFRGTCGNATVTLSRSGPSGTVTRRATGSEARDFQYPRYPLILSGWDANNNGIFPPADPDDTAVLDGNVSGDTNLAVTAANQSRVEIAHFSIDDYGHDCSDNSVMGTSGGSHEFWHDLRVRRAHRGCNAANHSSMIVFPQWASNGTRWQWRAYENLQMEEIGAFGWRGGPGTSLPNAGPIRIKNVSITGYGNNNPISAFFAIKLWDYITGIEVLDSVFEQQPAAWGAGAGGNGNVAISPEICSQDWTIRNNEIIDFKTGINIQDYAGGGYCTGRPVANIVIDGNLIRNSYEPYYYGDTGILVYGGPGPTVNSTVGNLTISNNVLSSSVGWEACMRLGIGYEAPCADHPYVVSIVNNTCEGQINRHAAIAIGYVEQANVACPQRHYRLFNNIISGLGSGQAAAWTTYAVSDWQANNNVYSAAAQFAWDDAPASRNQALTLAQWRTVSGGDAATKSCRPLFVAPASFDLHLQSTDTCARGAGLDASSYTQRDIDQDARPASGAWDAGADQYQSGGGGPPLAPNLLEVIPQS